MKLRLQESVKILNKLFAETAELSGTLTQFPTAASLDWQENNRRVREEGMPSPFALFDGIRQCRESIIQTLGIVQSICRVMLEETGEIKPLDIPEASPVYVSLGKNLSTGTRAMQISATRPVPMSIVITAQPEGAVYEFPTAPAMIYEFADGTFPLDILLPAAAFLSAVTFEPERLRIVSE